MINLRFCCLRQSYCYQILNSHLIQPFLKQWKAWKLLWQKTSYPSIKHFMWSVQKYAKHKQEKMLQQWTQILHYLHQSFHLIHLQSFHCSQLSSLKEPLLQATSLSQDPMDHTNMSLWGNQNNKISDTVQNKAYIIFIWATIRGCIITRLNFFGRFTFTCGRSSRQLLGWFCRDLGL